MAMKGDENSSWAVQFALTEFFHHCHIHKSKHCKYYCCQCLEALCEYCAIRNHKSLGHSVLQVRKTSHRDSIHVKDIQSRLVDPSCIQKILINNEYAMYLRPNTKKGNSHKDGININGSKKCDTCGSQTKPDSRFCSLACKVSRDNTPVPVSDQFASKRKTMVDDQHEIKLFRKRSRKQPNPRRAPL